MENPAATLHCPNTRCQAPNPQSNKFCQKCRTPLLRRYLWAIGQGVDAYQPGEVIAGRYLLVQQRIFLDTQPGMPPETPQEVPKGITPYLRLSSYGLHIPKVYGRLTPTGGSRSPEIWLLEEAPLDIGGSHQGTEGADTQGQLLPELTTAWQKGSAMRQLNWLWQLANLWQPFSSEGVASSLLSPALLRVEGPIVRLLELQFDNNRSPSLQQLGQLWSQLLIGASPVIAEFLQQLCRQLIEGQLRSSEELIAQLDQALKECGRSLWRTYQIYTSSNTGPSRNHNEDACYPPSGQLITPSIGTNALAIVCDGIGGHEGGEVASHLAIETLRERAEKLPTNLDNWNPATLSEELEDAACAANDLISSTNDNERRSERQRMGTTLVMAQTSAHEMYITHVGDSRVYWITRNNCYQVTLDDDLASREVRLGYALYRYAVQQPTSGSLVQALGMAPSTTLHPTVQRFVLDEDCIFLLCSDGLSDNDRVEQYWQTEILPILEGQIDLIRAGERLIEIANTQNGHDNATIALVYCKVTSSNESKPADLSLQQLNTPPTKSAEAVPTTLVSATPSRMKTQQLPTRSPAYRPWGLLLLIFCLLGVGGVLAYILVPGLSELVNPWIKQSGLTSPSSDTPPPATPSPPASPQLSPSAVSSSDTPSLIQLKNNNVPLLRLHSSPSQNQSVIGVIPAGSLLEIINRSAEQQQGSWLELRVCAATGNADAQQPKPQSQTGKSPAAKSRQPAVTYRLVKQGDSGWIREGEVVPLIDPNFIPTPAQQQECAAVTNSPTPTPKPAQSP